MLCMPLFWCVCMCMCGTVLVPYLFVLFKNICLPLFQAPRGTKIDSLCQHLYSIPLNFYYVLVLSWASSCQRHILHQVSCHIKSLIVKWAHGSSITLFYQVCEKDITACEIWKMLHGMLWAGVHQLSLFQLKKTAWKCFESSSLKHVTDFNTVARLFKDNLSFASGLVANAMLLDCTCHWEGHCLLCKCMKFHNETPVTESCQQLGYQRWLVYNQ